MAQTTGGSKKEQVEEHVPRGGIAEERNNLETCYQIAHHHLFLHFYLRSYPSVFFYVTFQSFIYSSHSSYSIFAHFFPFIYFVHQSIHPYGLLWVRPSVHPFHSIIRPFFQPLSPSLVRSSFFLSFLSLCPFSSFFPPCFCSFFLSFFSSFLPGFLPCFLYPFSMCLFLSDFLSIFPSICLYFFAYLCNHVFI